MTAPRAAQAALSLGGNLGDVTEAFVGALAALDGEPGVAVRAHSSVYRTPPWGKTDQPEFLNMATLVDVSLPPRALLDLCLAIERRFGRVRHDVWGPRTLDIDLLTYGQARISEEGLTVPHPHIGTRAFVLAPLAEIAPDLRIGDATVSELLTRVDAHGIEIDLEATQRIGVR
ncbi:MAG TPA: 2-amino-4-hydroxy-6-hydroxymethyldihydropteridine diphosphokinase, partial [Beijerinckiaceae bacterium]|nr:2-amino-4-hydroxy-6-hydroxymethyldihydropteridine diphosphokinase [Beijerinckiaceae bacterium]